MLHLIARAREGLFIDFGLIAASESFIRTWGKDPVSGRMQCDGDSNWRNGAFELPSASFRGHAFSPTRVSSRALIYCRYGNERQIM